MRTHRLLTPVLVAAAAVPLLAAPASAAKGPDSRDTGVHVASMSCTGDTVRVTAVVRGQRDVGPATVTLQAAKAGVWSVTGHSTTTARTKPGRNTWTLDASSLPPGATSLRAEIRAAGASVVTVEVPITSCAPGTEVPEVPIAPLLPVSLALTAAGVMVLRGRRAARPAA